MVETDEWPKNSLTSKMLALLRKSVVANVWRSLWGHAWSPAERAVACVRRCMVRIE